MNRRIPNGTYGGVRGRGLAAPSYSIRVPVDSWNRLEGEKMRIALGADHGGYELKEAVKTHLERRGYEVRDFGTYSTESVDYPDIAVKVARAVAGGDFALGILTCGTGIGMCITANKVRGVRAALCHDTYLARLTREHNDSNILTMGGRVIGPSLALDIVDAWLGAEFQGGRHARRVEKIREIENLEGEGAHGEKGTTC